MFFKDEDVAYVDQNLYPKPIAVMGPDWAGWLRNAGAVVLDGTQSYAMTVGASVFLYRWTVEPSLGATVADPNAATTTVKFTIPGVYWG